MNRKNFAMVAGTMALGLATLMTPVKAQGPMYDTVYVNLPYSVTIGQKTLQPGEYVIRELPTAAKSRVLNIFSENGRHFETSAMTIAAYEVKTPEDTKIVLHHFGPDYYFDKVWIQGKNYGYEFPLPDSVKARQREALAPVAVAARYEATPAAQQQEATATITQEQQITQVTPTPAPVPEPQVTPAPAPAPAPSTIAAAPAPEPQASREELPTTSLGWLSMLLSGGTLSAAGLVLRRRIS